MGMVFTSVWAPVILTLLEILVVCGLQSGWLRLSQTVSKWVFTVLLVGIGMSGVLALLGGVVIAE